MIRATHLPIFLILSYSLVSVINTCDFDYEDEGRSWNGTCAAGTAQSPVNIDTHHSVCDSSLMFDIFFNRGVQSISAVDNGFSLQIDHEISALYTLDINGDLLEYQAQQLHFHTPAEHTIDGKIFDLELHIVHKSLDHRVDYWTTNNEIAVLAVLFEVDNSAGPNSFIDALDAQNIGKLLNLDIQEILGSKLYSLGSYYTYYGSLTTPPCSESVLWYVISTPLKITRKQLETLMRREKRSHRYEDIRKNNRALQPLNGRTIRMGGSHCDNYYDEL